MYDPGILRRDYGLIRGLQVDHTSCAGWVSIWVVHLPERTEMGRHNKRIGPDRAGLA